MVSIEENGIVIFFTQRLHERDRLPHTDKIAFAFRDAGNNGDAERPRRIEDRRELFAVGEIEMSDGGFFRGCFDDVFFQALHKISIPRATPHTNGAVLR